MNFTNRFLGVCLIILFLSPVACQKPSAAPETSHAQSERSFASQVEDVRAGRSHQIRLDHTLVRDDDLKSLAGLQSDGLRVNLSRTDITDAALAELCKLGKLEQLRLASPKITDAGLAELAGLKQLRFLHLIDMPITDAGLDHLHALTNLESLYLDGTRVTDDGLARLLKALPNVHLHIDDHHHRLDPHAADHEH